MSVRPMTVRLQAEQALALEAVARIDEMPVSEAVRAAIDAHIEARRADAAFQERLSSIMEQDRQILERLAGSPGGEEEPAQRAVQRAKAAEAREYA
jgi:hypothetical protein